MKKRGMKKRVMAALMTACMVVGSVPGVSLADVSGEPSGTLTPAAKKYNFDGTASTATDPDIELNKTAVYNGTFTENGQTELTKTFEVGTKLTLADIPASKGKSSSYSDQTWDKFRPSRSPISGDQAAVAVIMTMAPPQEAKPQTQLVSPDAGS